MSESFSLGKVEVALSPAERFEEYLQSKGMRNTDQRRVMIEHVFSQHDHFDADTLIERMPGKGKPGYVSRPTVYRTLKLFEAKGILERHDFGHGRGHYEATPRVHHDHLIDVETGTVIEFRSDEIEKLQERIAREHGFKLVGHKLELYGVPIARKKKAP